MDAELQPLRELRREELPDIAALLSREWPQVDWAQRFQRQWFENPSWSPEVPLGWVHLQGGQPRTFFGNLPLPYWLEGRPARAFAASSLYVHPDLRRRGCSESLVRAWLEQSPPGLRVNATSNEQSAGVFEKLQLSRASRGERVEASRVARPLDHALRAARRRTRSGPLSLLLAAGAAPWVRWQRKRLPSAEGWSWQRLGMAGPELDALWERERPPRGSTFRRDAESLGWLYFQGTVASRNVLLLGRDAAGTPRALAGFWADRRTAQLRQIDHFGALSEAGALAALISAGTNQAALLGCASVRLRVPREVAGELLPWRSCEGTIYHRLEGDARLDSAPLFSDLDGDGFLELLL